MFKKFVSRKEQKLVKATARAVFQRFKKGKVNKMLSCAAKCEDLGANYLKLNTSPCSDSSFDFQDLSSPSMLSNNRNEFSSFVHSNITVTEASFDNTCLT